MMERVESFVAEDLFLRVSGTSAVEGTAVGKSFRGAVLFVDISDYTVLAETLCSQGSRGIEELGKALDRAFRQSVHAVRETCGEIACFAGDALIAYWPADDGPASRALANAEQCARLLHRAAQADVPSSTPAPSLHIGLSAGDLCAVRVGTEERWQLLLAGPAVREACSAAAGAAAGETRVAPQAEAFRATSSPNGRDAGEAQQGTVASTRALDVTQVPRRVREYLGEGYRAWIPQRRTICALFVRIDGLEEIRPDSVARYQGAVISLNTALRPYTGSPGTLLLDDKGLVFTLCLGMPHDTHADDELRAVRAGLAIRTELARVGLDCAIGVASGSGVCMPLGGPERRHYWPVGRFMHVAARLMEAAGSGLLCTEEVADRVRRMVSLSPERQLALKGIRRPVRAFRVRDATAVDDETDVLYGREDEQARVDQLLDACENEQGAVLWMVGDAGLGKTAIVRYLRHAASQRQIRCLSGGAGSVELAVAYAAWRPVFTALLGEGHVDSAPGRGALLEHLRHPQLAPLVNAVVPGSFPETPLAHSLSGQARADATLSVLSEVIGLTAPGRFVLVLEDCHWMDSASWRLVLRVAQDHPRALIVLTSRPAVDIQELSTLKRLDRFVEMKLAPLRPGAIESLVESVVEERSSNPELLGEIAQRSKGNPLFAREYALLLSTRQVERASATTPAHAERQDPGENVSVTVQSLIASRLDGLTPSEDLALKAASVVGDTFSASMVASVYPGNQTAGGVEGLLAKLTERQLIAPAAADERSFAFQHALIREVAYQQLTWDQRRDLHRRVAETIEREHAGDAGAFVAALAHHWSRAEVPDAAVRYSDQAASQALVAGAFEEAERLLRTCIQLTDAGGTAVDLPVGIRWHRQIADARHGMGQLESRRLAALQALRLAGRPRAQASAGLILQMSGSLCRLGARRVLGGRPSIADEARLLDVARAYRHSAEFCYFNNDLIGMICDSVSAVECASRVAPSAVLAGAATELGGILSVAGLRRIGERILRQAIETAEAAGDQAAQAHAYMISCLYYVGRGEWAAAEVSVRRCQELCEPMDDRVTWTNAQAVQFWMGHYRSHGAAAYEAACNLRDRASETGNRQHRAWALRCLALCALRRDDPVEACANLQAALECLGETAALNEGIPTRGILALAQHRRGDVWKARATAEEALAKIKPKARPIGHSTLEGYSSLVSVALDAWREERSPSWRRAIKTCLRMLQRYQSSFPVGEPRFRLHQGDYRRLSGRVGAARRSYRRGEAAASRLGMPWDAKRCHDALAALQSQP